MGAKLTKSKTLSISGNAKEQLPTTVDTTNNQLESTANGKNKKVKEAKSKKKSFKGKTDKSTNTENCVLPSSSFAEQLVGEKVPPSTVNPINLDTKTVAADIIEQPELLNKDVEELRDACFQNGIMSTEPVNNRQQDLNEDNKQENISNNVAEVTNTISTATFSNIDSVHYKE